MITDVLRGDGAARMLKLKPENFTLTIPKSIADGGDRGHVYCLCWWIAMRGHVLRPICQL